MKNIIITGTSSGIGLELVKIYSKSGYKVISLSRSDLPAKGLVGVEHINFDISKKESLVNLINLVKNKYKKIDILINNAGKLINKSFKDLSKDDLYDIYDVNVFGVISLIQSLLPFFKKDSHVVNISSIGGISGSSKFPGLTAYSSSKGALNILTEVLAEEFKESGPKFNSLSLGSVNTPMLNKAFPGYKAQVDPNEMASFIFDFANNSSKVFNGKVIPVSSSNP
jgi:NAD(P)-dependent dehydrogenase (short-subunit alcohol dehydrogenase family)|tara:strand:+ start:5497 stop:6171 length:675 start_codon:yes stop_codon:yes gene_type:complete